MELFFGGLIGAGVCWFFHWVGGRANKKENQELRDELGHMKEELKELAERHNKRWPFDISSAGKSYFS